MLMAHARGVSRRLFAKMLSGAALARICPAESGRLVWQVSAAPALNLERRYRADAQIILLGVTLLRRENVGGGSVAWREFQTPRPARLLEFSGYSTPERAAGLNRMGFLRELAVVGESAAESIYFGLMTASPEESAEEARKALHSTRTEQTYTAIDGRIASGAAETSIAHFTAPNAMSADRTSELMERARHALASAERMPATASACESSRSFLQALAGLLEHPDQAEGRYTFSGRIYQIRLSRSADHKATEHFRQRALLPGSAQAVRISGRVRRLTGGKETEFTLWVSSAEERPLPLRIEYQPKSYLRLRFEAVSQS
jgi:hypothetical protein